MKDPELLNTALEQFLGKSEKEIIETIIQTVEGHLRSILGKTFTIHVPVTRGSSTLSIVPTKPKPN
jgi:uncharacterized membrane protein YqiK